MQFYIFFKKGNFSRGALRAPRLHLNNYVFHNSLQTKLYAKKHTQYVM